MIPRNVIINALLIALVIGGMGFTYLNNSKPQPMSSSAFYPDACAQYVDAMQSIANTMNIRPAGDPAGRASMQSAYDVAEDSFWSCQSQICDPISNIMSDNRATIENTGYELEEANNDLNNYRTIAASDGHINARESAHINELYDRTLELIAILGEAQTEYDEARAEFDANSCSRSGLSLPDIDPLGEGEEFGYGLGIGASSY